MATAAPGAADPPPRRAAATSPSRNGRAFVLVATFALASLGANGAAFAELFRLHAFSSRNGQFLADIGNGSFVGLSCMADHVRQTPPEQGPVTCLYGDFRILHLLSHRVLAHPPTDREFTADEVLQMMAHNGSRNLVLGDEDDDINYPVVMNVFRSPRFHQLYYDNKCYFFEIVTPTTTSGPTSTSGHSE